MQNKLYTIRFFSPSNDQLLGSPKVVIVDFVELRAFAELIHFTELMNFTELSELMEKD